MDSKSPVQTYLEQLHSKLSTIKEGQVADYIPELAKANPDLFGIALVTVDGQIYHVGDCSQSFTIQSASKPIAYGLALQDHGVEYVQKYVGVEPSGEAFNSISLDAETGRPKNPMINAGAIATTSLIKGNADDKLERLLKTFGTYIGHVPEIDESVYLSERKTGHRNRALNNLMRSFGIVPDDNDAALDVYFKQCSFSVNCLDMAYIAACLANDGVNPITSVQALDSRYVTQVLSVMSSCGMYDYSGGWVYDVGMPAKSGVGGGIMAVLPGQFGIGVFSPLLDDKGNSVKGIQVCRHLSNDFDLHLFHAQSSTTSSVIRHRYDASVVHSRRARSHEEKEFLSREGARIKIYSLQGELMFGATDAITQHVTHEMDQTSCTIIDLNHVLDIDQASIQLFRELIQTLLSHGKVMLFTYTQDKYAFSKQINHAVLKLSDIPVCEFADNDRALEWCENYLLGKEHGLPEEIQPATLAQHSLCEDLSPSQLSTLESLCQPKRISPGQALFHREDPAQSMYFILEGELTVQLDDGKGHTRRITSLRPGMVIGEMTMINGQPRSANIIANTQAELLELEFSAIPDDIENIFVRKLALHLSMRLAEQNRVMGHFLE